MKKYPGTIWEPLCLVCYHYGYMEYGHVQSVSVRYS